MNIVVGHVALVQRTKKQDFVLRVIHALRKKGHDAIGLFPGECREPEYMRELEELVKEFKLTDSVLFLGRRNDIPDLLKLLDVLIIPSAFEGFPLAGLEAASAGIPVAACNVAGAREFVEVSDGGIIFDENDAPAYVADRILAMMSNDCYSIAGKRFASTCSLELHSRRMHGVFDSVFDVI